MRDFLCAMFSDLGLRCSILWARFSNYALKNSNLWKSLAGVHISWGTESVESNAESAETCHIKKQKLLSPNGNLYAKRVNFISKNGNLHAKSGKWHIQNAHSPENSSDEWALCFPYFWLTLAVTQTAIKSWIKIIIFHLSQSKCTVSALFLHGFKGCNGHSDLQNTTKGAEIAQWKITMLCIKITKTRKFQNQSVLPGGLF